MHFNNRPTGQVRVDKPRQYEVYAEERKEAAWLSRVVEWERSKGQRGWQTPGHTDNK